MTTNTYQGNFLGQHLRAASLLDAQSLFAKKLDGSKVSYQEFFLGAENYAKTLISKGLKPDDRVAVQVEKSLEVLQLYVGTVLAGGGILAIKYSLHHR